MKFLRWIWLSLLMLVACHSNDDAYLMGKNRLGKVHGGMGMEEVKQAYKDYKVEELTPQENDFLKQTKLKIFGKDEKEPELILFYEHRGDSLVLTAGEPLSPDFHTAEGVHIRDSYEQWRKHYEPGEVTRTLRHVVVSVPSLNMHLLFNEEDLPEAIQNRRDVALDGGSVKKSAKPEKVIVFFE